MGFPLRFGEICYCALKNRKWFGKKKFARLQTFACHSKSLFIYFLFCFVLFLQNAFTCLLVRVPMRNTTITRS